MSSVDCFPPPSPIQRILLIHLNLHEACTGEKSLGEGASLEELSEQILYYHRDRRIGITLAEDEDGNLTLGMGSLLEEAVQFLGLCTALYTLPSSMEVSAASASDLEKDRTKAIYFGNSTLVFIPLEESLDFVAIVQVARLYQNGTKSDTGSANPLAIRASIERCHHLFCMLRGGGVLYRLQTMSSRNTAASIYNRNDEKRPHQYPYRGMDMLFSLLKDIRKCKQQQSRLNPSGADFEALSGKIISLQDEVRKLRHTLPMQSIRRDLDEHYKEYLSEFSLVVSRNGGAGRCLVELMPVPIAQDCGSHTFQLPPTAVTPESVESLGQSIRQIIENHSSKLSHTKDFNLLGRSIHQVLQSPSKERGDKNGVSLLGISLFHGGQLLKSYAYSDKVSIPAESASLLMAYMASYRTKINAVASLRHGVGGRSTASDPQLGLSRLALSFRSTTDDPPSLIPDRIGGSSLSCPDRNGDLQRGQFMPSPPQYMMSNTLDRAYTISRGDQGQDIWAPLVHLVLDSTTRDLEGKGDHNRIWDTHMILFEFLHFSFLLFLKIPSAASITPEVKSSAKLLLMKLEEDLSETVLLVHHRERNDANGSEIGALRKWNEPGQDVVIIEPRKHRLVLFLDPKASLSPSRWQPKKEESTMSSGNRRRFLGFGPRRSDKNDANFFQHASSSTSLEWSALGLDCRHLLASHLPLDVCLAFDDMINEVSRRRVAQHWQWSKSSTESDAYLNEVELCTSMPHGWIYALGKGDKELYAFFDSSIYVTVADVQSAVLKIQEQLLG